jgi:hypothetical protein
MDGLSDMAARVMTEREQAVEVEFRPVMLQETPPRISFTGTSTTLINP